jgi:hypothetical protein
MHWVPTSPRVRWHSSRIRSTGWLLRCIFEAMKTIAMKEIAITAMPVALKCASVPKSPLSRDYARSRLLIAPYTPCARSRPFHGSELGVTEAERSQLVSLLRCCSG